jgi:uncharacterized membrane protein YphA (DoxX/SURF4 family)
VSIAASILSIILFLAFFTSGLQKVRFNPMMSESAEHLGITKSAYQRIGGLEVLGAVGLLVGLSSKGTSFFGVVNELAGACLVVTMLLAVAVHRRRGDGAKLMTPAMILGALTLLEVIFRLA